MTILCNSYAYVVSVVLVVDEEALLELVLSDVRLLLVDTVESEVVPEVAVVIEVEVVIVEGLVVVPGASYTKNTVDNNMSS